MLRQLQHKFSTDEMAVKSYVHYESDCYMDIAVRKLSKLELCTGRLILHSLLMLSLSFTTE